MEKENFDKIRISSDKKNKIIIVAEQTIKLTLILEFLIENIQNILDEINEFEDKEEVVIEFKEREYISKEIKLIKSMLEPKINANIIFEKEKETIGLYTIDKTYEKSIDISDTKYIKGSLRSGMKEEYNGSVVLMGDLNSGAEIIASRKCSYIRNIKRSSSCWCKW